MPRIAALALAVTFFVVQICCAQPMRAAAFDAAVPMSCPMEQEQECQPSTECSGGPQLVSDAPVSKFLSPVQLHAVAVVSRAPVAPAHPRGIAGWWSTPTRTIQLRI